MTYSGALLFPGATTFPGGAALAPEAPGRITPMQVAMGVGVAGAMVDVSAFVSSVDGIHRTWGRQDEFREVTPGTLSFTLFNQDGRFTPGNPFSSLATPVTEGTVVCWNAGGRLVSGSVLGVDLPGDEATWGQITIHCDDMLGNAARRQLSLFAESMVFGSTVYAYWPFNDVAGSQIAAEKSGNGQPYFSADTLYPGVPTFGVAAVPAVNQTQADFATSLALGYFGTSRNGVYHFNTIPYAPGSMGCWGFWFTPVVGGGCSIDIGFAGLTQTINIAAGLTMSVLCGVGSNILSGPMKYGEPHYFSLVLTTSGATVITVALYMDGVPQGTGTYSQGSAIGVLDNVARTPSVFRIRVGNGSGPVEFQFSHLSHTATRVDESFAGVTTEANRLVAISETTPELVLDMLPGDLSTAVVGIPSQSGTALDALNLVMHTEQGYLYATTTGALLAPVQKVSVRSRQRPVAATWSFDAAAELSSVPQFLRDITNMVSSATVTGTSGVVTVTDPTVTGRVGSSNASETILSDTSDNLTLWGQDRIVRGKNVNLRVASVTVDALTIAASRSGDLLAMVPGDRISITNLPSATLGFTTWDGWLLGVKETHTLYTNTFQMFVSPVTVQGVFDTSVFMADGALTLTAGIASTDTTMSVATTGPLLETVAVPYTLLVDNEQVTVTACTGATPQVATITRGVNGSTAIAHTTSAVVEVTPSSLFAF